MAQVKIGGVEYVIPELNFIALELAWPYIEEAMVTQDPMRGPSACISVIAAGLIESEHGFDRTKFDITEDEDLNAYQLFDRVVTFLKRKLKSSEISNVRLCVDQITTEAGLTDAEAGEAQAPAEETPIPSPETAPASSQSSLPLDAKEEAGTA